MGSCRVIQRVVLLLTKALLVQQQGNVEATIPTVMAGSPQLLTKSCHVQHLQAMNDIHRSARGHDASSGSKAQKYGPYYRMEAGLGDEGLPT